ncbi:MAG TPA: hypothetical protein VFV63_13475 [Ilumatobacteraceae bacterium]|nr:hypothetical protein [Ilumatobacteraceae bacterium]
MNRRSKVAGGLALGVMLLGGGIAGALWAASGSGSGEANAVTAQVATVSAATGTADLYPGFSGGDVFFTVTNPNPYAVTFASMAVGTVTSSDPAGCPSSSVSVASATGLSLAVGANATSATQSIIDVVTMAAGAPDACQGASFTIALTLSGSQG